MTYLVAIDNDGLTKTKEVNTEKDVAIICKEEFQKLLDKYNARGLKYNIIDKNSFVSVLDTNRGIIGTSMEISCTIKYDIEYEWPQHIKVSASIKEE